MPRLRMILIMHFPVHSPSAGLWERCDPECFFRSARFAIGSGGLCNIDELLGSRRTSSGSLLVLRKLSMVLSVEVQFFCVKQD